MKKSHLLQPVVCLTLLMSVISQPLASAQETTERQPITSQDQPKDKESFTERDLTESDVSISDLMKEVEAANQAVRSVTEKFHLTIAVGDGNDKDISHLTGLMDLLYDDQHMVQGGQVYLTKEDSEGLMAQEMFFPSNVKTAYTFNPQSQTWQEVEEAIGKDEDYQVYPDFHKLMTTILEIADGFSVYEDTDRYLITNTNKDLNLFAAFQPHYDLSLTGISSDQLDQFMTISFDKETYQLTGLQFTFSYSDELNAEFKVSTQMENWNELDAKDFVVSEDGQINRESLKSLDSTAQ